MIPDCVLVAAEATRWLVSKADASKARRGAALAATVFMIVKRTIDDVNVVGT